jgi:hypothetical protein
MSRDHNDVESFSIAASPSIGSRGAAPSSGHSERRPQEYSELVVRAPVGRVGEAAGDGRNSDWHSGVPAAGRPHRRRLACLR